ncbi:MAG TPA: type II toxin-antitoxin system VapC family toxin [Anaerolineae bacterium]|nr:type II toxin-antitoxin system VapC family toxin [Anaerolineae bacterium]HOQ98298.1 type II toxin-antitoxin system VapC family toxin [Anaerolineae bacterium]HPL28563.1 type II toxin-antitoxin system VapC family toxin [Anaerolineae bacterium]
MERQVDPVVIDANVAVALSIELPWSAPARVRIADWQSARASMLVPMLWQYEVISALRKACYAGLLPQDETERSLTRLFSLGIQSVEPDLELHREALRWAGRLGHMVAYDAQYLAVAERNGATLWTADRRLLERTRQCGVTWVHLINEY